MLTFLKDMPGDEQVRRLTGCKWVKNQCEWLRKHGYHFEIDHYGKVVVTIGLEPEQRREPQLGVVK